MAEESYQNEPDDEEKKDSNGKVVEWADSEYEPERENADVNSTRYETFCCCDCDKCLVEYTKFWLSLGCPVQYGYLLIFWYIVNLGGDVYNLATADSASTQTLAVLFSFNINGEWCSVTVDTLYSIVIVVFI